jgi:hypothetical protein
MFRLLEPANHSTPPDAPSILMFGIRWVICEYAQLADAPPYTCLSYAWGEGKVRNFLNEGQLMSARTVPSLKAAIASSQSQQCWADNIKFNYKGEADKEEAGQLAALKASQAFWIDAFCVPSHDPARAACLQDMGRIFSAAFQVIVVLTRQCSSAIKGTRHSEGVETSALLSLENEDWANRAWTYQEAVNSRAMYFTVEDEDDLIVSGQDFLRSIADSIENYKSLHAFSNITWAQTHPGLNNLEMLLADYRIADYTDRSAYQVMSAMGQRVSERPEDYFYAMIGSITTTSSMLEEGEPLHPAEYFMRLCEQKGDYSFIYSAAERSKVLGQGWRPLEEKLSAVLPSLIIFGSGEAGVRETTHIKLEKMFRPLPGAIAADGLKAAGWFMGPQSDGLSADSIASGILKRLRVLGFTGCGEYLEFETGFFFPQLKPRTSEGCFVALSCEINWVTGGPGLLLRSNTTDINDFVDVGAFVGRSPKSGQSINVR